MRCLTLADALEEKRWLCRFVVGPETMVTVPKISSGKHEIVTLEQGNPDFFPSTLATPVDLLIVDHYGLGDAFEKRCGLFSKRILVIEDMNNRQHDCDLLLDMTVDRREEEYAGLIPVHCTLLLGAEYTLLRPQFRHARAASLQRRSKVDSVGRILVGFGATDPENVTMQVLEALDRSKREVAVDVVLDRNAPHLGAVRARAERLLQPVQVHVSVTDMAQLMVQADLAIGAAGTTSWERCCLGLPTLIITLTDNQEQIARGLEARGAARNLQYYNRLTPDKIYEEISALCDNPKQLYQMSRRAMEVCDGQGVLLVVSKIEEVVG